MTPATALVVDDEPVVRHLVRLNPGAGGLRRGGGRGRSTALRLIQRRPESIDLVLTDLSMPGLDGFDVAEVLARHHHRLPVLCMSGYVSECHASRRLQVPFIQKPFTADSLVGSRPVASSKGAVPSTHSLRRSYDPPPRAAPRAGACET